MRLVGQRYVWNWAAPAEGKACVTNGTTVCRQAQICGHFVVVSLPVHLLPAGTPSAEGADKVDVACWLGGGLVAFMIRCWDIWAQALFWVGCFALVSAFPSCPLLP